jgi:hypothetical protein
MSARNYIIAALILLIIGTGVIFGIEYSMKDRVAPEITVSDEIAISVTEGEEFTDYDSLKQYVTAVDEEDGDVSDSILIYSVVKVSGKDLASVTIAAKDASNNIEKVIVNVPYTEIPKETKKSKKDKSEDTEDVEDSKSDEETDSQEDTEEQTEKIETDEE